MARDKVGHHERIIAAAWQEFLTYGFADASILLHLLAEEFRHLDCSNTLFCFWTGDVILPVQPLIGFIDARAPAPLLLLA